MIVIFKPSLAASSRKIISICRSASVRSVSVLGILPLLSDQRPLGRRRMCLMVPRREPQARLTALLLAVSMAIAPRRDAVEIGGSAQIPEPSPPAESEGSTTISSSAVITSLPTSIVRLAIPHFAHGVTSPVLRLLHNPQSAVFVHQHPPIGNLTTPVKNIARPVRVFRIQIAGNAGVTAPLPLPDKPSRAAMSNSTRAARSSPKTTARAAARRVWCHCSTAAAARYCAAAGRDGDADRLCTRGIITPEMAYLAIRG
jgi:hypothetical protein